MVEIKKATTSDLQVEMDIRLEMLRVVNQLQHDASFSEELIERSKDYFTSGDQTTVLAQDNGVTFGCASISYITIMPTFDHPTGKRAHLMNVYVRKEYRGKGIAAAMIKQLLVEAKKRNVTEISLDATEMGRPVYKKIGFVDNTCGMIFDMKRTVDK